MHDLLTLMYCAAANTPTPAPREWWTHLSIMCALLAPNISPPSYHEDPFVLVSLFHNNFEPQTLDVAQIAEQFVHSDTGTSTMVWGPAAWRLLHELAASPLFKRVTPLLDSWTRVLPCATCRQHLADHLKKQDNADMITSKGMYEYTVMLHNAVSASLGKPVRL